MSIIGYCFAGDNKVYVVESSAAVAASARQAHPDIRTGSAQTAPQDCPKTRAPMPTARSQRAQLLLRMPDLGAEDCLHSDAPVSPDVLRAALPLRFARIDAQTELDFADADCFVFNHKSAA